MYKNKEEALKELNKIIDEYGIGFSELKENYNRGKTVNTKKKDKVRIRSMTENEAIIQLLIPHGKAVLCTNYSSREWYSGTYEKRSEGKYNFRSGPYTNDYNQKVTIINNFYTWTYERTNLCGFVILTGPYGYRDPNNLHYAPIYEDNQADRIEVRINAFQDLWYNTFGFSGYYGADRYAQIVADAHKTRLNQTQSYNTFFPVFNI